MEIKYTLLPHPNSSGNAFVIQVCGAINSAFGKLPPRMQESVDRVTLSFLGHQSYIEVIVRLNESLIPFAKSKPEKRFGVAQSWEESVAVSVEKLFIATVQDIISGHASTLKECATRLEGLL